MSDLLRNNNSIDILTLSETQIRPTDEVSVLNVTGRTFLSLSCKTGSGGCAGLYILNQHDFTHREDLENANLKSICIEIFCQKSKSFLVCTIYDPLKTGNIYMKTSLKFLMICCH